MPILDILGTPSLWLSLLLVFVLAPALAVALLAALRAALARLLRREHAPVLWEVVHSGGRSQRVAVALLAMLLALPAAGLRQPVAEDLGRVLGVALTAAIGWVLTRMLAAVFDHYIEAARPAAETDFLARRRRTQLVVFRRIAVAEGALLTVGLMLTAIPAVRAVGLSLFASAGVAGVVIGLAARPAVSNLIAGLQLAMTQPIRIGDAVQVEGEWGHVEEIGSAYVTIATWDQRSLVVPIGYFVEKPVRNWTRASAQLLDTVFLYVDYSVPVEAIRRKAAELLAATPLWDGRVQKVQVTDLTERSMQVRVLMSAADPPRMFELRCLMREQLVAWLVSEYPHCLPRLGAAAETPPR